MRISISLPSLYPNLLYSALERIYSTTGKFDVEIVVMSPFEMSGPDIKWVREDTPGGNCAAHALAYEHATGEVLITLTDDLLPQDGWLETILARLAEGERRNPLFVTSLHNSLGALGTTFGIYYPYLPVLSRHTLRAISGYFSRDYIAHFGDADIGLRTWHAGGRCEPCLEAVVTFLDRRGSVQESPHKSSALKQDAATFLAKWKSIYGIDWPTGHIGDYNINVLEHVVKHVLQDGTIYLNDPLFAQIINKHYRDVRANYAATQQKQ